jgi:hypothetical protein
MPKVKWKDLPPQLRQLFLTGPKNARYRWKTSSLWKNGACILQMFQRSRGTRISDLSSSVEKVNTRKRSFYGVNLRTARKLSRTIRSTEQQRRGVAQSAADRRAGEHVAEEVHA